jgi:hypothetical protein
MACNFLFFAPSFCVITTYFVAYMWQVEATGFVGDFVTLLCDIVAL